MWPPASAVAALPVTGAPYVSGSTTAEVRLVSTGAPASTHRTRRHSPTLPPDPWPRRRRRRSAIDASVPSGIPVTSARRPGHALTPTAATGPTASSCRSSTTGAVVPHPATSATSVSTTTPAAHRRVATPAGAPSKRAAGTRAAAHPGIEASTVDTTTRAPARRVCTAAAARRYPTRPSGARVLTGITVIGARTSTYVIRRRVAIQRPSASTCRRPGTGVSARQGRTADCVKRRTRAPTDRAAMADRVPSSRDRCLSRQPADAAVEPIERL